MTYLEIGRLGPDVPVVADDGGLAEVAGADELIIYVGLPRHDAFTLPKPERSAGEAGDLCLNLRFDGAKDSGHHCHVA